MLRNQQITVVLHENFFRFNIKHFFRSGVDSRYSSLPVNRNNARGNIAQNSFHVFAPLLEAVFALF